MFASIFKRTHWLVPGYCLGQISCAEKSVTTMARNLRSVVSGLAKIGVILVSCSCGKWSPMATDEPQTASAINYQKPFVVLIGQNGLVLHIMYFAWNFCIKLVPHQLTVILGLVSTRAIFLEN